MSETNGDGAMSEAARTALLASPIGAAAMMLAWQCPLSLTALDHLAGWAHFACPAGGRVGCFGPRRPVPEGWVPTEAQRALQALLVAEVVVPRGAEGDEGRGEG